MTAAPQGPDLSFLNEEEARAIFRVLQRDAELRRAEKDRVSKLLKRKKSEKGLQGVTGEWFEEIKRKKFQKYTDVNRMLKPPLEHQLRKSKNTNHKELKMSFRTNPQAQKNTSASFLGFRSPFAWLSSFRKSRKTQTQKQPRQHLHPPAYRYDSSASPSSKVEEMATAEMCNSPMSTEMSGHSFDTNQIEMMEKSTQEWNDQLEKEFFSVLNDLDDQLAQEQVQDPLDRTVSTSSASNVQSSAFPTSKTQIASRGQQRNDWSDIPSTFFPDGLRTLRAKDEHKIFIRPRKLHSAYINWHQTAFQEDCKCGDPVNGNSHLRHRRLSAVSFGRSSEGSLYPPSVTQNSGFRHKSCMNRDTAGRSYSVCSLRRCSSSVSSDQLSASSLQHPLARESKNGFVPRFGRQNPKRIPLSSIVWNNTPDSPGQASIPEKMFRTQSLMEFHATEHGRYPSSLQETKKYTCYHSKHHYRRSISSSNCFSRVSCPDEATSPLPFDNWENYPLYKSENNLSRSYYRDISSHGKLYANKNSYSYGKKDSYPSWVDIPQCYTDETFLSPEANFEVFMANLNEQQWAHTKNAKFGSQRLENDFHMYAPESISVKQRTRSANRTFSEFTEGCQPWLSCNSSVSSSSIRTDESVFSNSKDQTKSAGLNRNSAVVTQRSTKADFTQLAKAEDMKGADEDMPLQSVPQQADTSYISAQSFSSNSPASAMWQRDVSVFNTMTSKRQTQVTARGDTAKIYTSNGDKRNVQMKENNCPSNSVFSQPPSILLADESRKEPFLPSQKEWEHNLNYAAQRESIKQDNWSAEAINQATPKRQSSLLNVASAPSSEKLANCQGRLSCPPGCSSSCSQSSPQAPSSSSVNCIVTDFQAEGENTAQMSRIGVTKWISQKTLQNASTLDTKDCNGQFTTSSPQNGNSENNYMHSFDRDPNTSENSLSYFCLEKGSGKIRSNSPCIERLYKKDSLLRHSSSCSITGSPGRNSSKSPDPLVIYYTLPRKSASIAGSIMSDMPISLPRESRTTCDCLKSETPHRADAFYSNQRDVSCLDSKRSFSTSASLNAGGSNKNYPSPLTKSIDSVSSSTSVDLTDRCKHLSRRESSVFSDYKEGGNFLQKYKTTSTFTVCVDEDHVKYHELVSIYYTLPRRHSRTFCSLFRDNTEDADLPCPKENAQSPRIQNKKNEDHVSLENVFFPTTSEKEEPSYSSDQVSSALVTPQNLRTAVDSEEENLHLSPSFEKSVSMVHSRKDNSAENVLSDMVTKEISLSGPQSTAIVAKSSKAISDASGSQNAEICLKEKKKILQRATPLTSTVSTPPKPGRCLENPMYSTSTNKNIIQKGNSESCCQPPKVNTKKNLNSLLLRSGEKSSLGRSGKTDHAPVEDIYRDSTQVKQRVNFLHQTTPLYNNKCSGLQLRADSSRKNANYLNSCSKVLSESQSKTSEVSTASRADPLLQLDKVVATDTDEVKNSKIRKGQNSQSIQMDKVYSGLQESERHSEGRLNIKDKVFRVTQDQKLTQSTEDENKLLSDFTRDKVKDIEKRKNRPSIKNKLAAVYKTSRKFSSKNLPPKPHISNIFSQNNGNAISLEVNMSLDSISTDSHQPFLQLDNENQNHSLDPDKNTPRPRTAENKTENHNDPSLVVNNTSRRSFTSSYTQKEAISPKKTTVKVENRPRLTSLFPDKAVTTRNKNSQPLDLRLESKSQPISPSATTSDPQDDEKGRASSRACTPPLPVLTDTNSNTPANSCLQADTCQEQNLTSKTALGQFQNTSQSASLENANLNSYQLHRSHAKSQRERHLSESICARDSFEISASGSNILPKDGIHGKRFKSYSELLSCDENENWASDNEKYYSTRNLMYPSVEFGIFGKEQQLAFLENIKKSLTEGRLWRPCLLNNPGAFRDRETSSTNRAELLSSSSAGSKMSSAASLPRELTDIYGEDPAAYSDSDSDTTTDDEYYLDEVDKESEL
ncbi:PREDICTED: KDEL motif-containing protein 2 isoform X3 [Lepidothrix coronata]|uniref:KDEL motif-containing protein 2 isoform X3 n=1 Tax=Lepidothrix coronata TaxID=321398 RepID=A0A6J0HBU5_9PASS|nr:PREDICTED: KDEL motif-containing protein 2 isoform X3 [Lepidothrix coronata]